MTATDPTAGDAADPGIDLGVPGLYLRPDYFALLARLRAEEPVHRTVDGTWAVTRYDDIRAISRDPERFVSGRGVLINDPTQSDGTGAPNTFSMLHLDPPLHGLYRKVVNREFTPRAVGRLDDVIRTTVAEVLDALPGDQEIDFVDRLASIVPIVVIADLFGLGDADRDLFRRWSDAAIAVADGGADDAQSGEFATMAGFLLDHIDSHPDDADDLLGVLKGADLDGRPLNRHEIMGFCVTLLVAGNETTRTLLSGGAEALATHPDQRGLLAADPTLLPVAVEELLRWVTPIQAFGRTAVVDVELGGQAVAAGDFLVMLYASGNRDEAAFGPTAATFDVRRAVTPTHVAFGFGEHLCLGAALARAEARIFFEELLARFPHYEISGPVERTRSTLVAGARRMPVVLAPDPLAPGRGPSGQAPVAAIQASTTRTSGFCSPAGNG